MVRPFSAAGRPRVVQNERAKTMAKLLKMYWREDDCTVRKTYAQAVLTLAQELDAFDEFHDIFLHGPRPPVPLRPVDVGQPDPTR